MLLAVLAATVGLGPAGWLAGILYGLAISMALSHGMYRRNVPDLGAANRVTLARSTLVGCVTALVAESFTRPVPLTALVAIATAALVLDAVDGPVARRTGTVSDLGGRFDMEVDAFLLLALSLFVAGTYGAWVLVIGGMRYAFLAAGWVLPWMRRRLPPRYWRKVVTAALGIGLVVAAADVLPTPLTWAALLAVVALLVESFGRDVLWLWRRRAAVHVFAPSGFAGARQRYYIKPWMTYSTWNGRAGRRSSPGTGAGSTTG